MSDNSQDDMFGDLLTDFLDESGQLLDRLDQDLLRLDELVNAANADDPFADIELLNTIFRSAHSLKGLSAMLGLSNINYLTHRMENVFDAARKNELTLSRPIIETTFRAHDALKMMIDQLRTGEDDSCNVSGLISEIDELLKLAGAARQVTTQVDAEAALRALLGEESEPAPESLTICDQITAETAPRLRAQEAIAADLTATFAEAVDETEIPAKYVAIFIDETELSLDEIQELLCTEASLAAAATSEMLLITMHRIKGSAASIGLNRAARLAHIAEDLLQDLREKQQAITPPLAESLLGVADALRTYVAGLRENNPESSSFVSVATSLVAAAQGLSTVNASQSASPIAPVSSAPAEERQPFAWTQAILDELQKFCDTDKPTWFGHLRFAKGVSLPGMKAQLVIDKLSRLGTVPGTIPALRGLEDLEELADFYFVVQTNVSEEKLRPELTLAGVEDIHFHRAAGIACKTPVVVATEASNAANISPPATTVAKKAEAKSASTANNTSSGERPNETLRVDIERLDQLMNLAGQLVINKARFAQIGNGMKDYLPAKQTASLIGNAAHIAERALATVDAGIQDPNNFDTDSLRLQIRRLAADLHSAQAELERINTLRNKVNELGEAVHQLDRVAEGIQKSVMDTRMVPIGPLFQRFKRVVRDVTRTNSKDVRLTIRGEKTELDKRMIDELGDPLIHMVRNSADHGVESPEVRQAAGKNPQGEIILDAFHRGNSIVIQVRDDGKGLDRERILAKAIERGIISSFDAERMTPHQIHQLIWEPGFSTAEKVTEISGRGMGMDIVRSKIEALSGTVEVDSVPGQGTVFTIKLPLTLAILPSLMSVIEGDTFAIPLESIVEIVRVKKTEIATIHGIPAARIRGRVISIVDLNELFAWTQPARAEHPATDDVTLVVIGHESQEIGLIVDHVIGEDDIVIKSLAENYKNVAGIAGASILGNGCVSLILDVTSLLESSSKSAERAASSPG